MSTTPPAAQRQLTFYRVMAFVTGTFLLVLTITTAVRYLGGVGEGPFLDAHVFIATVHGWIFVVYLAACAWLWLTMKWALGRFAVMALGGIVPLLSFFVERRISREVAASLDA